MWSLSRILYSPEVPHVYIGSFTEGQESKMWVKSDREIKRVVTENNILRIYHDFKNRLRMAESDLPDIQRFIEKASLSYAKAWHRIDPQLMKQLDDFIEIDVPSMVEACKMKEEHPPNALKELFSKMLIKVSANVKG
ncbi:hypothetical protein AB6A40_010163 [Gnathostoma spinigerum]|uniref:DUF5600 domain-containing protein n=1 Tax=Gnathostoma spinigerum TaxID=75299 RepID=A0ABD6EZ58_9BILA